MFITKHSVTITADSTGESTPLYTTNPLNGLVHSIVYKPTTDVATILSTTCTLKLDIEGDTDAAVWNRTLASTDMFRVYPRVSAVDTTGAAIGNTTDYPFDKIPVDDKRIKITLGLSTAAGLTGTLEIYVEGN